MRTKNKKTKHSPGLAGLCSVDRVDPELVRQVLQSRDRLRLWLVVLGHPCAFRFIYLSLWRSGDLRQQVYIGV